MDSKKMFEKYHSRLVRIGWLKALLCALIAGFAVIFIVAAAFLFSSIDTLLGVWVALGVGVAVTAISMPIFYFRFFKPTARMIARAVDKLGLEERLITMYELEHDDSYIAMVQREDAQARMREQNAKAIKFQVSKAVIIVLCIVAVLGIGMTTVTGLTAAGLLVPPTEWTFEPPEEYTITYEAADGGFVDGMIIQIVTEGEDGEMVYAMEDDGYIFVYWLWKDANGQDQMSENPAKIERNVQCDMTITAYFMPIIDFEFGDGEGDGEPVEPDEIPDDLFTSSNKPTDNKGNGNKNQGFVDGMGQPADGDIGTPGRDDNNTVVDGRTQFESEFDYEGQKEELSQAEDLPDDLKDFVGWFFDSFKPSASKEE